MVMDEQQEQQKPGDSNTENSADTNIRSDQQQAAAAADFAKYQQDNERRRQAFESAKAGPVGAAINDVNAFLQAMDDCHADTPEAMLADSDVQQAAKRAREGLKVFTGDTPVIFSKPTSDAHLNVGSGGAVTGNTAANVERAAAVKAAHDDDDQEAVPGVAKVPQPDALVR
jgi:hypothetical protein